MKAAVLAILAVLTLDTGCAAREAAPTAPAIVTPPDVVGAAKATLEKWRLAYEQRDLAALGALYAKDLDLVVVQEGVAVLGWTAVEVMLKERLARAESIHVRIKDIQVVALGGEFSTAIATMSRELASGTTTITEQGTVSLVLRKLPTSADWIIVVEHYSYNRS